jgi:hypothetical protein
MNGPVVQAGSISGGVHHQTTNIGSQNVTVNVRAFPPPARRSAGLVVFFFKFGVALFPLFLCGVVIGVVAERIAGGAHPGVRLAVVVAIPALGMAVIALWAVFSGRRVTTVLGSVLDKTISPWFARLPTPLLVAYIGLMVAVCFQGVSEELSAGPDRDGTGLTGIFGFVVLLVTQTAWTIVRRR